MQVAVWDTYVTKKDGNTMHFDIIVPASLKDEAIIFNYGQQYLSIKNQQGQQLASKECNFCHIEEASEKMLADINAKGFHIIEMQGCN